MTGGPIQAAPDAPAVRHTDAARAFEPTAHYAALRDACPVHRVTEYDPPFYVLTRFADVVDTLKDHDHWQNRHGPGVFYQERGVLGTTDEPDHGRHRRVLRAAFLPTVIDGMEPRIAAIADQLIDGWIQRGEGDFISLYAGPFPALVIAEVLGIGAAHRDEFRHLSDVAVAALTGGDVQRYAEAKAALEDQVAAGVAARRARLDAGDAAGDLPDDVLGRLAVAEAEGTIDHTEMRHLGYQLLVAGHETTTSLLGLMLYRLLERPELLARLRTDPGLIPATIEETLRFDSPVHGLFRTNAEGCVLHGVELPASTKVQVAFAAANRDPAQFADPDRFDIDRPRPEIGRHVAFGWGIHHCIGAPLARLSARVTFERLLARLASIELAGPPVRNDSFVLHGLTSLPLRWSVAG